jgi:hypothetical protein
MGSAADSAVDASASQVAGAFGMLGVTPMIGQNDSSGEIFALADASTVESCAASKGLALTSFWSEGRDNDGCPGQTSASSPCSGATRSAGQFTSIFQACTSGTASTGGSSPTATATASAGPTATSTGGSGGSCATAWNASTAYTSGQVVSYGGYNWTASQWNYDEVPGGASGAWHKGAAC